MDEACDWLCALLKKQTTEQQQQQEAIKVIISTQNAFPYKWC